MIVFGLLGTGMDVQFWAATDVGKAREHNEDNFLVDKRLNLFIVCDGMGGHAAGEVASAVAVRAIRDVVANNRDIFDQCSEDNGDSKLRKDLVRVLEYSIQEACTRVYEMAQENSERRGMGTTCSLMMVAGRRCFIAHVGDSRIYLYRKGQVHQLTEDHTLANEMLRRGRVADLSEVEAKYKNAITRAVGVYESVEVDTLDFDVLPGDRFLLCSDGLSGYLDPVETIERFVAPADEGEPATQEVLKGIANELISFANDCGGKDNITAVLVGLSDETESIENEDVRLTMETIRNIPLFHYLSYKELVRIVNVTQKRLVDKGSSVIREGAEGEELFIIMRGTFVVTRGDVEVARLGPGRHFGEMALIDDGPRSATVTALSSGTMLTIRRGEFYDLLRKDPTLAVKLLWNFIQTLSARLRQSSSSRSVRHHLAGLETLSSMRVPPGSSSEAEMPSVSEPEGPTQEEAEAAEEDTSDGIAMVQSEDARSVLSRIRHLEMITGEEITLPGISARDLVSLEESQNVGDADGKIGGRRHRHHAGQRVSSALSSVVEAARDGADENPPQED